jgi:ketosteroid isomerase-like protein
MTAIDCARRFYDAVAKGDIPGVLDSLHPELAWTEAEGFPYFSGTWTKPQEVVEKLLVPLGRDWDGFAATPHEFLAQGEVVVTFGAYSGTSKATAKPMSAPFAHRWEVRDGKLARFDMFTDTLLVDQAMR